MPRMSLSRRALAWPDPAPTLSYVVGAHAPGFDIELRTDPAERGAVRLSLTRWLDDPSSSAHGRIVTPHLDAGVVRYELLDAEAVRGLGRALLAAADHLPESVHVPRGAAHHD